MECISCESLNAFNRAVINQLTGKELGFYCEECESKEFGEMLEDSSWHQENGCAFCHDPGKYKLPRIDCAIEHNDGSPRVLEYIPSDYTITLCSGHTKKLFADDDALTESESREQKPLTRIEA